MFHEPLGAGFHVLAMLRLGGNAGEAHVVAKFVNEPALIGFQVIQNGLHGA
jgi:hypothetical protein